MKASALHLAALCLLPSVVCGLCSPEGGMQWRHRRSAEEHPALALAYVDVALAEGCSGEGFVRHITGVPRARVVKRSGQTVTARIPLEALEAICDHGDVAAVNEIKMNSAEESVECSKLVRGIAQPIPARYIVTMEKGADCCELEARLGLLQDAEKGVIASVLSSFGGSADCMCSLVVEANSAGVRMICSQPEVEAILEDQLLDDADDHMLPLPPPSQKTWQWGLDRVDQRTSELDGIFQPMGNGSGVDIYILDSGIQYMHTQFQGRARFAGVDLVDVLFGEDQKGADCQGHGSRVASIAVGQTLGVAVGAHVKSLRVSGVGCRTGTVLSALIEGIDFVIQQKRTNPDRPAVITISSKTGRFPPLDQKVKEAVRAGITVVVAGGNDGDDACKYSPGTSSDVITVGGTRQGDALYKSWRYSSNYGRCVDIMAPAQGICGANYWSHTSSSCHSGTSYAAPMVAGAVAILLQTDPSLTPEQIKEILNSTCTKGSLNFQSIAAKYRMSTPNCLLYIGTEVLSSPHMQQGKKETGPKTAMGRTRAYQIMFDVPASNLVRQLLDSQEDGYIPVYIQTVLHSSTNVSYSLIAKKVPDNETVLYPSVDTSTAKHLSLPGYVQSFAKWYTHHTQGSKPAATLVFERSSGPKKDIRISSRIPKWRHIRAVTRLKHDGFLPDIVTAHVSPRGMAKFTMVAHRHSRDDMQFAHVLDITAMELLEDTLPRYQQSGYFLRYLDAYTHRGEEVKYVALFHLHRKVATDHPLLSASTQAEAKRIAEEKLAMGYVPIVAAKVGETYIMQFDRKT